ncbi:MAG: J domain-containing protein [Rhodomicrobium sp.]
MTTAYDVLGIDSNADDAAIKAAFRRAAKKCHPDLNEGDRNGERLRLLIAARAAALSSLRQLERKSRDLAAKAAGKERSSILAGTLAGRRWHSLHPCHVSSAGACGRNWTVYGNA